MKKNLLLLLCVIFGTQIFAQDETVNVGFEVNPLVSFAIAPNDFSKGRGIKMGVHYGLNLDINLSKRFALNTGVYGSVRGGRVIYGNTFQFEKSLPGIDVTPGSKVVYNLQYLEIPTNLKLKTNRINKTSFFALFGFSHRFNIASRTNIERATEGDEYNKQKTRKDMRFYDVPFNFGVGVNYQISDGIDAVFGLKYTHGLIDITKRDNQRVSLSDVQLTIGLMF